MSVGRKHDETGRSTGRVANSRVRKRNGPPEEQPWSWLHKDLLESCAWRALSVNAHRLIGRVLLEHQSHGGAENGELPITYDDLEDYGIRRNSIRPAMVEVQALGLVTFRDGKRAFGGYKGAAAYFRIAWYPTRDGGDPSVSWKRYRSLKDAKAAVKRALAGPIAGTPTAVRAKDAA